MKKLKLSLIIWSLIISGFISASTVFCISTFNKNFNQFKLVDTSIINKVKEQIVLLNNVASDSEAKIYTNENTEIGNKIAAIEKKLLTKVPKKYKKPKIQVVVVSLDLDNISTDEINDSLVQVDLIEDSSALLVSNDDSWKDVSISLASLIPSIKDKDEVEKLALETSPFLAERKLAALDTQSTQQNGNKEILKKIESKIVDETKITQSKSIPVLEEAKLLQDENKLAINEEEKDGDKDSDLIFISDDEDRAKEFNVEKPIAKTEAMLPKEEIPLEMLEQVEKRQETVQVSQVQDVQSTTVESTQNTQPKVEKIKNKNIEMRFVAAKKEQAVLNTPAIHPTHQMSQALASVIDRSMSSIKGGAISSKVFTQTKVASNSIPGVSSLGAFQLSQQIYSNARDSLAERVGVVVSREGFQASSKNASFSLNAYIVAIGKGEISEGQLDFDFNPGYDSNEVLSKEFKIALHDQFGHIGGVLSARETVPMRVDLTLQQGKNLAYSLPLFERNSFYNYAEKLEANNGGFVLLENQPGQELIDLEIEEEASLVKKICLDESFKKVDSRSFKNWGECDFILLMGVEPGLRLLTYKVNLRGREQAISRLIPINDAEIFYDALDLRRSTEDKMVFFEEQLAGSRPSALLTRNENSIESYTHFKKKIRRSVNANNQFEMLDVLSPFSSRQYLIFKDDSQFYVGKGSGERLVVPAPRYRKSMREHFIEQGVIEEAGCIVQINLPDDNDYQKTKLRRIMADMNSNQGSDLTVLYLDQEGNLFDDLAGTAKKIFILGNTSGAIDVKIDYQDRTKDYFQTYCGENTYMVEQL